MSGTLVSLLTPPATGAIATIEARGPRAYSLAKPLFTPAGKPLPESPEVNRFYFGTLGADEVVLAVTGADAIEVHCHGGQRVVRWVMDQFLASGGRKPPVLGEQHENRGLTPPARLLERAPTLRTASILLDQLHGAFALEVQQILRLLETDPDSVREPLRRLAELGNTVGRHLVEPWKVVVAGAPNVGKSSLVNALAGYQRAVVSEVAGTTRDAVNVRTAFDGWPVELIDTAGLREAEGLEAEGTERAKQELTAADLVVWVLDATASGPVWPDPRTLPSRRLVYVVNKCDRDFGWDLVLATGVQAPLVSATTGQGIDTLAGAISRRLVPITTAPGAAVPFGPRIADLVDFANSELSAGRTITASGLLRVALG